VKATGFVIGVKHLGERLRKLSIYTDRAGRITATVKLQRGSFPLGVDLFSMSFFTFGKKAGGFEVLDYQLLLPRLPGCVEELFYLSKLAKVLNMVQSVPTPELFELTAKYMSIRQDLQLAYAMFLLKFSFIEGILPVFTRCVLCGSKRFEFFSVERGGVVCPNCLENSRIQRWSSSLSKTAVELTRRGFADRKTLKGVSDIAVKKIAEVMEAHIHYRL
jgi:DNA repair protein RecO (recombination protein O)